MSTDVTRDTVLSVDNDAFQRYITGEEFLNSIRRSVREAIHNEINTILTRVENNEEKLMDLECSINEREKEIANLKVQLKDQRSSLDRVERAANIQEQYSRRNCLRFYGVAQKEGKDTDALICGIANEKLKVTLRKEDIERSHRLPSRNPEVLKPPSRSTRSNARNAPKQDDEPKPDVIFVKFVSCRMRKLVISKRRELKGTKMGIEEEGGLKHLLYSA